MLWAWDIGDDIKKLERAKKVKIDVIDRKNNKGKFIGSSGEIYRTNLLECTCVDFSVKKTFCKHMLRLAMELGVVNSNGRTPEQQESIDLTNAKNTLALSYGYYYLFGAEILSDKEYDSLKSKLSNEIIQRELNQSEINSDTPECFPSAENITTETEIKQFPASESQKKERSIDEIICDDSFKFYSCAANSEDIDTLKLCLDNLRITQKTYSSQASPEAQRYLEDDIQDLASDLSWRLQEKWGKKVENYLDSFEKAFVTAISLDLPNLSSATEAKKDCLHRFDSLNDMTLAFINENSQYVVEADIWEEFKEDISKVICSKLEKPFQIPQASSVPSVREKIDLFLSNRIDSLRPKYQRKGEIQKEILSIVKQQAPLSRSELLKMLKDFDSKEVSSVYRYLIMTDKLDEYKTGNRYFVVLHDKQQQTHPQPSNNPSKDSTQSKEVISSSFASVEDFLRMLDQQHIPYIDKRSIGCCIWIKSGMNDRFLSSVKIGEKKLSIAGSSRAFKGNAGWYLRED